ncbi:MULTISPECIES: integrase core domain-containing protein [unclassified Lentimonas]|uniref:integrase core domain-containing protein n=1 Tax=unclassified Lentimonas TaxID=2630993 RepID=UPI001A7E7446|nr:MULTISPECIES: integrase core domain-containing protein [unclassified Lentimonas]
MPEIIRVDHGTPFASNAWGGLLPLSVWWIEQGIRVELTRPGCPQDNGSHERSHRDMKAEVCSPASPNMKAQQKRFDRWRHEYHHDRPRESLGMLRPAEVYRPSSRRLGEQDKMRYPQGYQVKRVRDSGHISHCGSNFYLSEIYAGCNVGLFENLFGITELHYANLHLGDLEFNNKDSWRPKSVVIKPDKEPRAARPI